MATDKQYTISDSLVPFSQKTESKSHLWIQLPIYRTKRRNSSMFNDNRDVIGNGNTKDFKQPNKSQGKKRRGTNL